MLSPWKDSYDKSRQHSKKQRHYFVNKGLSSQGTMLLRPWDSPGKNTGVSCHFLLQCMKVKVKSLSRVRLLATPWTAAYQAPPSMGFARQEYWSGLPLPSLIALTRQNFFGKGMSLLFTMLSRLVLTFLPRSKHLLISWLQSPSAVILSDTVSTVSHLFPMK